MDTTTLGPPPRRRRIRSTAGTQARPPIRTRPWAPDDGSLLDAVFDGLSPRSRYLRFHGPLPRLPADVRAALLDIDDDRHAALVAEAWNGARWTPIGTARVIRTAAHVGEIAVEVVDAWQGRGVGRLLLDALRERAIDLGYRELHGHVLLSNAAVLSLLRGVFPGSWLRSTAGGTGTVVCPLGDEDHAFHAITMAFDALFT